MAIQPEENSLEDTTLESQGTVVERSDSPAVVSPSPASSTNTTYNKDTASSGASDKPSVFSRKGLKHFFRAVNIYLLLFILIILIAAVILVVVYRKNKTTQVDTSTINGQSLSNDAIKKLSNTDTTIGDAKQILNVESNAVFTGKVLIRDSLDVAGTIRVGGPLTLPGITVAGNSSFDQVTANKVNVSGDTSISGNLNLQKNVTVSGGATFGGALSAPQLNIEKLQLSQDIQLNRHIDAGGGTPRISSGSGVGGGGTASVNGTDTAGTVTVNTGSNPPAGALATVTFVVPFAATPHVVVSPIGSGGANIGVYLTRTSTGFTIASSIPAAGSTSFSFDYIVID